MKIKGNTPNLFMGYYISTAPQNVCEIYTGMQVQHQRVGKQNIESNIFTYLIHSFFKDFIHIFVWQENANGFKFIRQKNSLEQITLRYQTFNLQGTQTISINYPTELSKV